MVYKIIYVPGGLVLEDVITRKYAYLKRDKHIQRMYFLAHLIYINGMYYGKYIGKWTNLYCRHLERILTRKYAEYKAALLDAGVIVSNESYIVGKYTKSYRISIQYDNTFFKTVKINDVVLNRNIDRWYQSRVVITDDVSEFLFQSLRQVRIAGNIRGHDAFQSQMLHYIKCGDLFFHRDEYGRVHTNITNLKKMHRKDIAVNGHKLHQVDIVNSQPLIFNILINELLKKNIIKEADDLLRYKSLTESGQFYDYCMNLYNVPENKRNSLKKRVFKYVFYGKGINKKFAKKFPTVSQALYHLKNNDYRNVARKMQKIESEIVIDGICGRIMKEVSDIPVITVHDCILTTKENLDYVSHVMYDEFLKLGLNASIEVSR